MSASVVDLGGGRVFVLRAFKGEISGGDLKHRRPDGGPCEGFIPFTDRAWAREFAGRITTWEVVVDEPLTLAPSIKCRACGDHGYIRDGKWEGA